MLLYIYMCVYVYILYMKRVIFCSICGYKPASLGYTQATKQNLPIFVSLDIVNIFICRNWIILNSFK